MYHPDQSRSTESTEPVVTSLHGHRGCLVPGCPCKDSRIVSHRRAAFFADLARRTGETANRIVVPDPAWSFRAPVAA